MAMPQAISNISRALDIFLYLEFLHDSFIKQPDSQEGWMTEDILWGKGWQVVNISSSISRISDWKLLTQSLDI